MHNAGFHTVAACEAIDWRRTLYSENNPGVPVYDDVRTLTAARLLADLADHLRLDAGLSAWLAGTRVAVGGPRGTAAASLIVEAFGDAVVPQIPEAIGRAILRVEAAMAAVSGRVAA